jgi:hypothetical protein
VPRSALRPKSRWRACTRAYVRGAVEREIEALMTTIALLENALQRGAAGEVARTKLITARQELAALELKLVALDGLTGQRARSDA